MARNYVCYCHDKASHLEVDCNREIVRFTRELPPAHCFIKIESFSTLSKIVKQAKCDKYECKEFRAGGYKWSLCIYPEGNKKENGEGHISLYLKLVDIHETSAMVDVSLKFFVFDQIRFNYLTIADIKEKQFHAMKDEWGVPTVLSRSEFNNVSNGFLIDDSCVFGVEAFVLSKTPVENGGTGSSSVYVLEESELLSELPKYDTYIWKIKSFSEFGKEEDYHSPVFNIKGYDWKLLLYPQGHCRQRGKNLWMYLRLNDLSKFTRHKKLATEFEICVWNKFEDRDWKITRACNFCKSIPEWSFPTLLPLKKLNDPAEGFKVNDFFTIQVTIRVVIPVAI